MDSTGIWVITHLILAVICGLINGFLHKRNVSNPLYRALPFAVVVFISCQLSFIILEFDNEPTILFRLVFTLIFTSLIFVVTYIFFCIVLNMMMKITIINKYKGKLLRRNR